MVKIMQEIVEYFHSNKKKGRVWVQQNHYIYDFTIYG